MSIMSPFDDRLNFSLAYEPKIMSQVVVVVAWGRDVAPISIASILILRMTLPHTHTLTSVLHFVFVLYHSLFLAGKGIFFSFLHHLRCASIHQELRSCFSLTQDSYTTYQNLGHQFPRNQEPWSVDNSGKSAWALSFNLWAPTHECYNK